MKKIITLLCLLCCIALAGQAMAYTVSLTPASQTIQTGGSGQVDVNLMLTSGEELFGFNMALSFDPSILKFDNLSFGALINANYLAGFTPPSGTDNLVTFDGGLLASGGVTSNVIPLASLFFTGIASGTSSLTLEGAVLDFNALSEVLVADLASINVGSAAAPVPEPAACLLVLVALTCILFVRKRYSF
ncbi:cohesin domain-containing protein [Pelotalea chapellei]|uniref:Cohesin domain-containing protein n=1 Tax=Pelotalea chapellei TaxID=44671 RepID=A0ABS5U820_9BACT|nr:cohesin domain-containing protein [Pelotalea chapellei]MBT1071812.1 cohesin domain-containing protein [Pelotalea chapellei]